MGSLSIVTPAAQEPLSLEEVKADRRITFPDDDAVLAQKISAARAECEHFTHLTLMTQTLRLTLNQFPPGPVALPAWPVQSIDQVRYVDGDGTTQTLAGSEWVLVESRKPRLLAPAFGKTWPVTRAYYDSVLIDIVAGYGTASSDLPADLVQAMLMMIGSVDEFREDFVTGTIVSKVPVGSYQRMVPHVFYGP